MRIRVRVSNHQQFTRLARRFREAADGQLERDLGEGLRRAAPPVVTKIQGNVLGASFPASPSRGGGGRSTGFRAGLAGAVKTEPLYAPVGVRFFVDGEAVGKGDGRAGHKLALYTEGIARDRWRHQVFGNAEAWFNQLPDPWFFPTFPGEEARFARAVEQAMDQTIRRIAG